MQLNEINPGDWFQLERHRYVNTIFIKTSADVNRYGVLSATVLVTDGYRVPRRWYFPPTRAVATLTKDTFLG